MVIIIICFMSSLLLKVILFYKKEALKPGPLGVKYTGDAMDPPEMSGEEPMKEGAVPQSTLQKAMFPQAGASSGQSCPHLLPHLWMAPFPPAARPQALTSRSPFLSSVGVGRPNARS